MIKFSAVLLVLTLFWWECDATVITAFASNRISTSDIAPEARATRNFDPRYQPWPTPTAIPYMFDTAAPSVYTTAEKGFITGAMAKISAQMSNCIQFTDAGTLTSPGIFISKTFNNGTLPLTCQTFPGKHYNAVTRPQKLIMIPSVAGGNNGCLGSIREAMKLLVNVLGLRDEWKRSDRTNCITVNPASIDPAIGASPGGTTIATAYPASATVSGPGAVDTMGSTFDYFSITIPATDKWHAPGATGTPLIQFPTTVSATDPVCALPPGTGGGGLPITLPTQTSMQAITEMSVDDCRGLKTIYPSCTAACVDNINGAASIATPFVTVAPLAAAPRSIVGTAPVIGTVVGGAPIATPGVAPGVVRPGVGVPGVGIPLVFDSFGNVVS